MGEPFHWRSMTSVLRGSPDVKAWHAALALARRLPIALPIQAWTAGAAVRSLQRGADRART